MTDPFAPQRLEPALEPRRLRLAPRRDCMRALLAAAALSLTAGLAGCDFVAQKKLIEGQHTEADVRQLMGVPTFVWDQPGGGKEWDYVRGPRGFETWRVAIGPDGKYRGMRQLLTEENFRNARVGMTREELRRMFSRPFEVRNFELSNEEVWSWRYEGDGSFKYNFNAHIDPVTGRARRFSRTDDLLQNPGV